MKKRRYYGPTEYQRLRFSILKRDKFTCRYCGRRSPDVILEVDHINPKSKGGKSVPENLATACRDCNQGKGPWLLTDQTAESPKRIRANRKARQMAFHRAMREDKFSRLSSIWDDLQDQLRHMRDL